MLGKAEADLDALRKDYQHLVNNDRSKKSEYEESMLDIETHNEKIMEIRLAMGTRTEKIPMDAKEHSCSSVLPKLEAVSVNPLQENHLMPTLIQNNDTAKSDSGADVEILQSVISGQALQSGAQHVGQGG